MQTEPASNMPKNSIGLRLTNKLFIESETDLLRISPEIMYGISGKWMVHIKQTVILGEENKFYSGASSLYAKYRFLSIDDVQKHTRVALFGSIGYSKIQDLAGVHDILETNSSYSTGIIITQLWHKLALSTTIGMYKPFANKNFDQSGNPGNVYNYSLSAGYLLLPVTYKSYNQINLNAYLEILGTTNRMKNYEETHIHKSEDISQKFNRNQVMIAPGLQAIFSSRTRMEGGYSFPFIQSKYSKGENMVMLRIEHLLFLK